MEAKEYIIGIDEAGRGPLAGPVAVGIVVVSKDFSTDALAGITDSKLLTKDQRTDWFETLTELREKDRIAWEVTYAMHTTIDRRGIVRAVQTAVNRGLRKFSYINGDNTRILLDGSLRAPRTYPDQETIIRGDEKHPIISSASVAAKVTRDRTMERYGRRFSAYGFGQHKGYPTPSHYEKICEHGPCEIHRRSFIEASLTEIE